MNFSKATLVLLTFYLCLFSLWPFYIDLRLAESVGINPQRLALAMLVVFSAAGLMADRGTRRYMVGTYREHRLLFLTCIMYAGLRLVSGAANGSASFFIAAYEIVSNIILIFVATIAVRNLKNARFLFAAMVVCALLVSAYALVERQSATNIFSKFADPETRAGFTAMMDKTRDGAYRVQSTFEHPLSLSQYLVVLAPLSLVFYRSRKFFLLAIASFFCMLLAAAFTGSRSAIVAPLGAILLTFTVLTYHRYKAKGSGVLSFTLTVVASVSLLASLLILPSFILGDGSQSQSASTATRVAQIQNGYIALKSRPLLGYGPGRASAVIMSTGETEAGAQTIHRETTDNLFLTRAVESGVPSLLLYLTIIYSVIRIGARNIYADDRSERRLRVLLFISVVSGVLTMLILSIFTVLPLLFVMFGVTVGLGRKRLPIQAKSDPALTGARTL